MSAWIVFLVLVSIISSLAAYAKGRVDERLFQSQARIFHSQQMRRALRIAKKMEEAA